MIKTYNLLSIRLNYNKKRNSNTCLLPLDPRCGDATVMKFIASRPPIVPFKSSSNAVADQLSHLLHGLYNFPIAYLATSPPTECATNEIL